jgi:hypothetical protein
MANNERFDNADPQFRHAAEAVSSLSAETPPAGLAQRTINRITAECRPFKKAFWMLRPITHPLARLAAAALFIITLTPLTNIHMAAPLGSRIEQRVIGSELADRIEVIVDGILVKQGTQPYRQEDLDEFMGLHTIKPLQKTSSAGTCSHPQV